MTVTSEAIADSEADRDAVEGRCNCCTAMSGECRSRISELKEFADELKHLCRHLNIQQRARRLLTVEELKNRLPVLKWIPKYR